MINRAFLLALAIPGVAQAQTYNNATLNAKYYFRELYFVTDATGKPTDVRSASGAISFDGNGGYSVNATQNIGTGNPAPLSINGTYTVSSNAALTFADPLKPRKNLNARYTSPAVFGSSSDASGQYLRIFTIAIPQPAGGYSVKSSSGTYFVSTFEITGANLIDSTQCILLSIQPDGKGAIPGFNLNGHGANINSGQPTMAFSPGASYILSIATGAAQSISVLSMRASTSAEASRFTFPKTATCLSEAPPTRRAGLSIGIRAMPTTPPLTNASWSGDYFTSGLRIQVHSFAPTSSCYTGGLNSSGSSVALFTRRLRQTAVQNTFNFTGSTAYSRSTTDASFLAGNYVVGLGDGLFVQTEVGSGGENTGYEIGFGAALPQFSGTGVYINPYGIVNAASNAPGGAPLSPGEFVTVFGANLATATLQAGAPYPMALGGVTVTVNNIPAPLYLVSKNQVSFLVPYAATGNSANVVIKNSTGTSNTVTTPLASTSPGIYSVDYSGAGSGVILHADYSLVDQKNPAKRGETVLVYLTGLGAVKPAVADGVVPSNPLTMVAMPTDQLNVYIGGMSAAIQFAGLAPGYPGLYQINVTIPKNLPVLGAVGMGINTPDSYHDQVSLYIQ